MKFRNLVEGLSGPALKHVEFLKKVFDTVSKIEYDGVGNILVVGKGKRTTPYHASVGNAQLGKTITSEIAKAFGLEAPKMTDELSESEIIEEEFSTEEEPVSESAKEINEASPININELPEKLAVVVTSIGKILGEGGTLKIDEDNIHDGIHGFIVGCEYDSLYNSAIRLDKSQLASLSKAKGLRWIELEEGYVTLGLEG